MKIGQVNELKLLRFTSVGAYLGDEEDNDVLLPNKYLTDDLDVDDSVEVFIYRDSEDRIVATTERPYIELFHFAYLKVKEVNFFGAFMDWGLEKDLMVPFKEQNLKFEEGRYYLVYLDLDESTDRLYGSAKVNKFLHECKKEYDPEQLIDIMICDTTDLGVKVIVDGIYSGLIFKNDISRQLKRGEKTFGYISKVREDGKLDVRLDKTSRAKISDSAQVLMEILENKKYIPLTDKSDPDEIRAVVGMSKKTFKQAVGNLYKQRLITIEVSGIYLVE
ncbi:S1-like domain-containing RNA-binding protein [Crocinitomicaceae bacterium]|jgi:predicted RNA-binding protein (virulence factor B family)|nr:S1-like domain-containing RNA-binding protein [Crocinitomicaceae bacterium]